MSLTSLALGFEPRTVVEVTPNLYGSSPIEFGGAFGVADQWQARYRATKELLQRCSAQAAFGELSVSELG